MRQDAEAILRELLRSDQDEPVTALWRLLCPESFTVPLAHTRP